MAKFRSKPSECEAYQFTPESMIQGQKSVLPPGIHEEWIQEGEPGWVSRDVDVCRHYVVTIHKQKVYVEFGDWIATEPDGKHYYPIKPEIFPNRWEPAAAASGVKELTLAEHVQLLRDIGEHLGGTGGNIVDRPNSPSLESLRAIRKLIYDGTGMDFLELT